MNGPFNRCGSFLYVNLQSYESFLLLLWSFTAEVKWCLSLVSVPSIDIRQQAELQDLQHVIPLWTSHWIGVFLKAVLKALSLPTLFHIMISYCTVVCWTPSYHPVAWLSPHWQMLIIAFQWSCKNSLCWSHWFGLPNQWWEGGTRLGLPCLAWHSKAWHSRMSQPKGDVWREASRIRAAEITDLWIIM